MRRIKSKTAGLIIVEVILAIYFITCITNHYFHIAIWVFVDMFLLFALYFLASTDRKIMEHSDAVRAKNDELRNRNNELNVLVRNLTIENAELRKELSRKRPKPQTEEKSDE